MAQFNPLKISDLRKDENRPLTFIRKVDNGEEFTTVRNGNVIILKDQLQLVKLFMTADGGRFPKSNTSIEVKIKGGRTLKVPNDFLKNGWRKLEECCQKITTSKATFRRKVALRHLKKYFYQIYKFLYFFRTGI